MSKSNVSSTGGNMLTISLPGTSSGSVKVKGSDYSGYPVESRLNGGQLLFAKLGYQDIQTLEGRLLTLADATFQDREQRRAFKDMLRREIWFHWANYLDRRGTGDESPVGIPNY